VANLTGVWLGTYWQGDSPTRFEVTFLQSGNTLTGNILDDGNLGEANLSGQVIGTNVSFTKTYLNQPFYHIRYVGILSADSDTIDGDWTIQTLYIQDSGKWTAHRTQEDLSQEFSSLLTKKADSLVEIAV
jgi:hypothetical protein